MAEIVFVHGIAQEQVPGPKVENEWILAMAGGLENAGFRKPADRLRLPISAPERIEARMAYYGVLFVRPGERMGSEDDEPLSEEQQALRDKMAMQCLERAAKPETAAAVTRTIARQELAQLRGPQPGQEAQGPRAVGRRIIEALCRVPGLAHPGMAVASQFVVRELNQVTKYLTDDQIRSSVQERIAMLVTPDTRLIVGHSLGSVAAYEAAHRLARPLGLLLTLGSPLGLRSIVLERLRPPPSFPLAVRRWVNVADPNDFVAAEPDLRDLFAKQKTNDFDGWRVDNGDSPHSVERYLNKTEVGAAVGPVLS